MSKITIYKVTCVKSFAMYEQGETFSLSPWGENTDVYEGYDDGGAEYYLPEGFEITEMQSCGEHGIFDTHGNHAALVSKFGKPAIMSITMKPDNPTILKKVEI